MNKDRLVYDCNVYPQFLLNADGPGGACVRLALENRVELFVCAELLREIRELPLKKIGLERALTPEIATHFIDELLVHATCAERLPALFVHPIDPDDSF